MEYTKPDSYEAALAELEEILDQLESQSISVDHITEFTKKAKFLINFCQGKLRQIEDDTSHLL